METKEQKPWYQTCRFKYADGPGPRSDNDRRIVLADAPQMHVAYLTSFPAFPETDANIAALIAAAPETATQLDSLLSVQKQLVEALSDIASLEADRCHNGNRNDLIVWEAIHKARAAILAAKAAS